MLPLKNKKIQCSGVYPIISNYSKVKLERSNILSNSNKIFLSINSDYTVLSSIKYKSNFNCIVATDNSNIFIQDYKISKYKLNSYNNTSFNFPETSELSNNNNNYYNTLLNDSNRFYVNGNLSKKDSIIPYKIKDFLIIILNYAFSIYLITQQNGNILVYRDNNLNNLNTIINTYIPKDLHQANLKIRIDDNKISNTEIILSNFYNGRIIINYNLKEGTTDSLTNILFNVKDCDYLQINNILYLLYTNRQFLKLQNVKYCIIDTIKISQNYSNLNYANNASLLRYKTQFIPTQINNNNLLSVGNLIYSKNSNLLLKNISILAEQPSLVPIIADYNSHIVSQLLSCNFISTSKLLKRPILFYSCRNSKIDAISTYYYHDGITYNIDFNYDCSNYHPSASVIWGYSTIGSIFNHSHKQHFLTKYQVSGHNRIDYDLPIGSIYEMYPLKQMENQYLSTNIGIQYTENELHNKFLGYAKNKQLKFGFSYKENQEIYKIYSVSAHTGYTRNDYCLFPSNNVNTRLYSINSEDLFFCQRYYPIIAKSFIVLPQNLPSYEITISNYTTMLNSSSDLLDLTKFTFYNEFFNVDNMIFKYANYTYMPKKYVINVKKRLKIN